MEGDIVVRKVVQDVLLFVWQKQGVIEDKKKLDLSFVPQISSELMNNLSISVWIDSYCQEFVWQKYLKKHFKRMTASPYLFCTYVAYANYRLTRGAAFAHEKFLDALSVITHFALHCWQMERKQFLNTCVDSFCAFFEKEIRSKFEEQGGWEKFNEYLLENQASLKRYKELVLAKRPTIEIFREYQEEYLMNPAPYVIDGIPIHEITECQVEDDKQAVEFAESVASKMSKLCSQTFEKMLADFDLVNRQVEELYRLNVGEACGGKTNDEKPLPPQEDRSVDVKSSKAEESPSQKGKGKAEESPSQKGKEAFKGKTEGNPIKTNSKKGKSQRESLDSVKSQDSVPSPQKSEASSELSRKERAKIILASVLDDIDKLSELIKFVCTFNSPEAEEAL